jgi:hypothetical protein
MKNLIIVSIVTVTLSASSAWADGWAFSKSYYPAFPR